MTQLYLVPRIYRLDLDEKGTWKGYVLDIPYILIVPDAMFPDEK
jgi:hypothetical protein